MMRTKRLFFAAFLVSLLAVPLSSCKEEGVSPSSRATSSVLETSSEAVSGEAELPDIVVSDGTAPTVDTSSAPAEKKFPAKGYCAVGTVEQSEKTATVVAHNGVKATVHFEDASPKPGGVYAYEKTGVYYTFSEIPFINGSPVTSMHWQVALFDQTPSGMPDIIYTNDGKNEFRYDFAEDSVIFVRFSETEWMIFSGSDSVKSSGFPVHAWFAYKTVKDKENPQVTVMVIGKYDPSENRISPADAGDTYYLDHEGYGWNRGDILLR